MATYSCQLVCRSTTTVVNSSHKSESAVVPVSHSTDTGEEILPMFQILQLPQLGRRLRLMVDSASPVTFINSATWKDLDQPKLSPTNCNKLLGAFEGQPIKPLGILHWLNVKTFHHKQQCYQFMCHAEVLT